MKELKIIVIITLILVIGGFISVQFSSVSFSSAKFNFYKSEITIINTTLITEKLYFQPDKSYHTLFRNFIDPVYPVNSYFPNSIEVLSVSCAKGNSYFKTPIDTCYKDSAEIPCPAYTESNEYGCTFGNDYGFFKGNQYTITANYLLNPENIFSINGKNYIKFVVYSPNNHRDLTRENFIVSSVEEIVKKDKYSSNENVIIYIPYAQATKGKQILSRDEFEFDKTKNQNWTIYLLAFIPALIFFFSWLIFGKENLESNLPNELSMMPDEKNKRKPWEVAAYFNPPFSTIDKNVFSSALLNFYHKKVIDIKLIDDEIYIKTNPSHKYALDNIESQIFNIITIIETYANNKHKKQGYVNLKAAPKDIFNFSLKSHLMTTTRLLAKDVAKRGKEFLSSSGTGVALLGLFLSLFITGFTDSFFIIPLILLTFFIVIILNFKTALFSKYKGEFYREYQHWQAFKRYLDNSFSIREGTHKTIVMWEEYLVYATALGVSKKVVQELKTNNLINERQERLYLGTFSASSSFVSSSGVSGGSHGGAGGGGVGGGGGGGR